MKRFFFSVLLLLNYTFQLQITGITFWFSFQPFVLLTIVSEPHCVYGYYLDHTWPLYAAKRFQLNELTDAQQSTPQLLSISGKLMSQDSNQIQNTQNIF